MSPLLRSVSLALLISSGHASADEPLPADAAVRLLLRALAYDRSLNPTDGVVQLTVVTRTGQPNADGEAFAASAAAHGDMTVQGAKLKVSVLVVSSIAELDARLAEDQPHVVYVGTGFEAEAAQVLASAKKNSVHCVYGVPGYEAVLPLGVVSHDGAPRVVVRRAAARSIGAVFDPQLLKLALLVD